MRSASVCMLLALTAAAAPPKVHTVAMGAVKRVPFIAADVSTEAREDEAGTLRIRPLIVDGKVHEWLTGDTHEITERSFVARRVIHVNDTLPGEAKGRWVWQPASWILVDRVSGKVTALHLPDFDAAISDVTWYRDYAAYCGIHSTAKNSGVTVEVWQIGAHKAALAKVIGGWPQRERVRPVCLPATWQREPMRVTLKPNGGDAVVYDVVGTSTQLVEDGEGGDEDTN